MTQTARFTDSSCYHAALATLLNATEPDTDPFFVLGNNAATAARLTADGELTFSDPLEPLTSAFTRHGYRLTHHPVRTGADWRQALDTLRSGRAVAIAADAYHLEHYWVGFRTSHALHVVVLEDFDAATATVRLVDPGEAVFHDGRIPVARLTPAMCEGDAGQAWMEILPLDTGQTDAGALPDLARQLSGDGIGDGDGDGDGGPWLSGTALIRQLQRHLDTYLAVVGSRPRGSAGGTQQDWGPGPRLLLGLWWYHHTLRWLAGHLRNRTTDQVPGTGHVPGTAGVPGAEDAPAETVEQASRDLLVVRNLMMRLGAMDEHDERFARFRAQLHPRLETTLRNLESAAAALTAPAKEQQ
ncbi:BtrH N-terminal domain-containing protein [Streptomyces murinus]|uniref:hypothetical protein n=1 Tax=Streptomyces murinus TaxID=33900 RepID=UPI000A1DB4CE|nr:hypothetical protein [Streptomyces murinus]WDO09738.1 BtrH N-terminal domain-containing protein [Streptomyces murinus]